MLGGGVEHKFIHFKKSPHHSGCGCRSKRRGEAMLELVSVVRVDPLALVGEQKGEGER